MAKQSRSRPVVEAIRALFGILFLPHRAARTLRDDVAVWPALIVAIASYCVAAVRISLKEGWQANAVYLSGITCCIVCNVLAYAVIAKWPLRRSLPPLSVRSFVVASFYTTCFVAGWAIVEPPMLFAMNDATFFWPFAGDVLRETGKLESLLFVGCSIIYYWWWCVLAVFAGCRLGWRRGGWLFVVVPPLATFAATRAGYWVYTLMDL